MQKLTCTFRTTTELGLGQQKYLQTVYSNSAIFGLPKELKNCHSSCIWIYMAMKVQYIYKLNHSHATFSICHS